MFDKTLHPTYDIQKSYEWNYQNGPVFKNPFPPIRENIEPIFLLGFPLASRLGVAAGPLLNSEWIKLYSKLGFDILTYKTVRSYKRLSNPVPNCLFIETEGAITQDRLADTLRSKESPPIEIEELTITNSFGVPSRNPRDWQEDVEKAKGYLNKGQVLVVSVMGSSEIHPDAQGFIQDFGVAARMAKEAGADMIELDLSCPNSNAAEGMVFSDASLSAAICKEVRSEIGSTPLLIKVGYFKDQNQLEAVIHSTAVHIDAIVGINTLKMKVLNQKGEPALSGRPECGVCGAGIKPCALQFARWTLESRKKNRYDFSVIGVGGMMTTQDIDEFLDLGLDAVEVATAAMWDPYLATRYYLSNKS